MSDIPLSWLFPTSIAEAKIVQNELRERLILENDFSSFEEVIGLDVSCNRFDPNRMVYAGAVCIDRKNASVLETGLAAEKQNFPYIPGFLGFREVPVLLHAFQKLSSHSKILFVDGHGTSHPRKLGVASHLGIISNSTTIGIAKSILIGEPASVLGYAAGSHTPLIWKSETIGILFRSRKNARPIIISAGHKICLETAVSITLEFLKGYRLPEPTRQAHFTANNCRRLFMSNPEELL